MRLRLVIVEDVENPIGCQDHEFVASINRNRANIGLGAHCGRARGGREFGMWYEGG